ncbi:MAG: Rho termination factor N-terminal domain-containing protein, partial [Parachlamydiaceae bacterium]|nr:Rho termination factor N-terminal domain-containing protein [Parachlamydiaceae bacterium]
MDPENYPSETSSIENESAYQPEASRRTQERSTSPSNAPILPEKVIKIAEIQRMNIDQLNVYARNIGLRHLGSLTKSQVVFEVVKAISENPDEVLYGEGVLEILPDGFGFLRSPYYNYLPSAEDIYVSPAQIRRLDLKKGDTL